MGLFLSRWMPVAVLLFGSVGTMGMCGCQGPEKVLPESDRLRQSHERLTSASRAASVASVPQKRQRSEQQTFDSDWSSVDGVLVTLRADGLSWAECVTEVAEQAGLGIVVPEAWEDEGGVVVRLVDVTVQEAFDLLGGMRQVSPVLQGNVVRFQELSVGAIGVVPSGFLPGETAGSVVERVVGQDGTITRAGSSVVVAGTPNAVERAVKLGEWFQRAEPEQWGVEVWFVEVSSSWRHRLGVELGISGSMAGLVTGTGAEVLADVLLESVVTMDAARREGRVLTQASVVLVDGETATIRNVQSVPVPEKSTSPQGTVTTEGYTMVEAGLILNLSGRAVPGGSLNMRIAPELSSITGTVEDHPIIDRRSMDFSAQVGSGDWVIVAGLDTWRDLGETSGLFGLSKSREQSASSVLVIMRAARLGARGRVVLEDVPDGIVE